MYFNSLKEMMTPKKAIWIKKINKFHKWPGIIIAFFALLFAVSGIILNHRNLISAVDIQRKWMPPGYQYSNWNLASVRSSLPVGTDSILIYGNIGAWIADGKFTHFRDFNSGFPVGIDKRKIYSILKFKNRLVAGTHFGLYTTGVGQCDWSKMWMPEGEERISDLALKGDTLLILTRDHLYGSTNLSSIFKMDLPEPVGYQRKAGLFLTLWELHSGELFGLIGKLFVDLLGFILIFLSLTGLLHFFFPKWIGYLKRNGRTYTKTVAVKKWNLKWHNLIGYLFALFLFVNTMAGMFLRPPLLIPIASSQVSILPYSHLDTHNPWHDKLRRISWDSDLGVFLIYTSDGFFAGEQTLKASLVPLEHQPTVSVMGCNVLERTEGNQYLVGSFSGLFLWNPATGNVVDYFTGQPVERPHGMGRPVGNNMVAGFVKGLNGEDYWFDYNLGAQPVSGHGKMSDMPAVILQNTPISLWNAALEVHTGRIFEHLVGPFYLLYVPLIGLTILVVLVSGFLVWWMAYRKKGAVRKHTMDEV